MHYKPNFQRRGFHLTSIPSSLAGGQATLRAAVGEPEFCMGWLVWSIPVLDFFQGTATVLGTALLSSASQSAPSYRIGCPSSAFQINTDALCEPSKKKTAKVMSGRVRSRTMRRSTMALLRSHCSIGPPHIANRASFDISIPPPMATYNPLTAAAVAGGFILDALLSILLGISIS